MEILLAITATSTSLNLEDLFFNSKTKNVWPREDLPELYQD